MTTFNRTCAECGDDYIAKRSHGEFCSGACKSAFNNRRFTRGSQLYDLFMTMRYQRDLGTYLGVWSAMCRMAEKWRDEDNGKRGGRHSWGDVRQWFANNPWVSATRLPRTIMGRMKK